MQTRKPKITSRTNSGGSTSYCVDLGKVNGKRQRKFFTTKTDAKTYAEQAKTAKLNLGAAAFTLSDKLRVEAIEANNRLKAVGATLTDATDYYLLHAKPVAGNQTVNKAISEFLEAKREGGRREVYVQMMGYLLKNFGRTFGERLVHEVGHVEIQVWLRDLKSPKTHEKLTLRSQAHYHSDLRNFFGFAVKKGYRASNPFERLDKPKPELKPVGILTVAQANKLFSVTFNHDQPMLAFITLGAFAGLRREEIIRLDWDKINLADKHIEITAAASKTRQRRIVRLSENAVEWLAKTVKEKGPVAPADAPYRLEKLAKRAGIDPYPRNALRHSFASYLMGTTQNAAQVAEQLGHTNLSTLYTNYRELVRPKDAANYWQIRPEATSENIIPLGQHACG